MPVVCLKFCTFGVIALYFSLCKLVFFVRCQRALNPGSGSMVMQHNSSKNNQHCHDEVYTENSKIIHNYDKISQKRIS